MALFPTVHESGVPFVTTEQMVEVDRAMIEDYGILLIQMMENAGRNLAHLARVRFLSGNPQEKRVAVLAGVGGNGGGALVCARRLANWGADVQVLVTRDEDRFREIPRHQLRILRAIGLPIARRTPEAPHFDLIVDGVIGYSLKGAPRGGSAELIAWANEQDAPTLSLDAPSGIDTTTGTAFEPSIRAAATMTLALPKKGLRSPAVRGQVGELYLADIGVPPALYAAEPLELEVGAMFAESEIVEVILRL
jgi:NAD(P)H-hydrate epimerase